MKSFKSFYEDLTFKVEVEGLPAMWMSGNSPGQVKNHLRKLVKQPSMIKSVKRQTKFDVKKMYRDKAQGKEVDEMTQQSKDLPNLKIAVGKSAQSAKDTKARADKRKANKQGTSLAAGTKCGESTVNELDQKTMNSYFGKAQKSKDRATNSAVATILRKGDHSKDLQTRNKRDKGMALAKSRTITKMRGEATSGEVDYGTDKSVKIMKKVTPLEARMDRTISRHADAMKIHKAQFKKTGDAKHMNAFRDAKKRHDTAVQKHGHDKMEEGKGLWANIHAKRKRGERMRKKGEKGAPTPAAIKSAQKEDVTEKITIGKIRKAAYKTAKVLGDVNAVKKGKVARRVKNRVVGKMLGKAVSKLGLFR